MACSIGAGECLTLLVPLVPTRIYHQGVLGMTMDLVLTSSRLKTKVKLGMIVHICHPSAGTAEAGV